MWTSEPFHGKFEKNSVTMRSKMPEVQTKDKVYLVDDVIYHEKMYSTDENNDNWDDSFESHGLESRGCESEMQILLNARSE